MAVYPDIIPDATAALARLDDEERRLRDHAYHQQREMTATTFRLDAIQRERAAWTNRIAAAQVVE